MAVLDATKLYSEKSIYFCLLMSGRSKVMAFFWSFLRKLSILSVNYPVTTFNPIRSRLFQTVNDPVGGFKSPPPPPTISKTIVSIFTISYM